jgi:hypothetical protein
MKSKMKTPALCHPERSEGPIPSKPREAQPWTEAERASSLATLEILTDRALTDRLLNLSKTIDRDVAVGRLLTTADVFGE